MPEFQEMARLCKKELPTSHLKDLAIPLIISMYIIGCNTYSLVMFWGGECSISKQQNPGTNAPLPIIPNTTRSRKRSASEICIGKGCKAPVPPDSDRRFPAGLELMELMELKKGKISPGVFSYYNTYGVYDKIHISVEKFKLKKTIWKSCVGKRFFHFKIPNALKLKTQIIPTSVSLDLFVLDMGDRKFDAERYD